VHTRQGQASLLVPPLGSGAAPHPEIAEAGIERLPLSSFGPVPAHRGESGELIPQDGGLLLTPQGLGAEAFGQAPACVALPEG